MVLQQNKIDINEKHDAKIGSNLNIEICNRKFGLCFCHRLPDRSLTINGYTLPICARCTGIVMGSILSIIMIYFNITFSIMTCLILLIPLIVDGGTQYLNYRLSNNSLRLATGILFGIGYIPLLNSFIQVLISFLD